MAEMTKEARAARAKYMREWRKKNPEKQREYDAKKWERKGQQIRQEREAASNEATPDSASLNMRQFTAQELTIPR